MPSFDTPSEQVNCKGSLASCGTVNGMSCKSARSILWPSRAVLRRPFHSQGPMAIWVPWLIHTGILKRRAKVDAQPMWSPCSWVMNTASMSDGCTPASASRRSRCFKPKPQSTNTRVVLAPDPVDSIRVPLPVLPLPRLLNLKNLPARRSVMLSVCQSVIPLPVLFLTKAYLRSSAMTWTMR